MFELLDAGISKLQHLRVRELHDSDLRVRELHDSDLRVWELRGTDQSVLPGSNVRQLLHDALVPELSLVCEHAVIVLMRCGRANADRPGSA